MSWLQKPMPLHQTCKLETNINLEKHQGDERDVIIISTTLRNSQDNLEEIWSSSNQSRS